MSSLISVHNLSRHYGDYKAVNDISFELSTGDILGFLGPNGAGKSTTMQMLSGNLAPTIGEISINGTDLLEQPKMAKASLGYLPDTPPLYREMTVMEYLKFCAQLHSAKNKKKSSLIKSCHKAIEQCGLGDVRHRLIGNLSKGYQQRVGIAQAILHSPPVIILDEPTVGLDPIQILEIRELIRTLGKNHGIILSTHILPEVQAICNRVQIINNGSLVYHSSMADIQQDKSGKEINYEITLAKPVEPDQLASYSINNSKVFSRIETTDYINFIVSSHLEAQQLSEYIVQQGWGLVHFSRKQTSLEQIFIDLSLNDQNATPSDSGDTSSNNSPAGVA